MISRKKYYLAENSINNNSKILINQFIKPIINAGKLRKTIGNQETPRKNKEKREKPRTLVIRLCRAFSEIPLAGCLLSSQFSVVDNLLTMEVSFFVFRLYPKSVFLEDSYTAS